MRLFLLEIKGVISKLIFGKEKAKIRTKEEVIR